MNEHLPKYCICHQPITWNNKLTVTVSGYEKANTFSNQTYTNSVRQKVLKKYDYHKCCYQRRHPEVYAKLEGV